MIRAGMTRDDAVGARSPRSDARSPSGFDVALATLSLVLVCGFFLDLWAHNHGRVDDTFFTPWHAFLYGGAGAIGGVLGARAFGARSRGEPIDRWLPAGYGLSLIGVAIFLVAGGADLVWHETFGFEENTDALLSPSHLLLAIGGVAMVAGPARAAWRRGASARFPDWLVWMVPVAAVLSILTAFTMYAHPAVGVFPREIPATGAERSSLLFVDLETGAQTRLPGAEDTWMPTVLPDGSAVVATVWAGGDEASLVKMNLDGSDRITLWTGPGRFNHAAVSPDGSRIAFNAMVDGHDEIMTIGIDGGDPVRVTTDPADDWGPDWSPDGQTIVFSSNRDGDFDLYTADADGGAATQLLDLDGLQGAPAWSPDGSLIAFGSSEHGDFDIYVVRADGSRLSAVSDQDSDEGGPVWSPDGRSLAFSSSRDGDNEVYVTSLDGGDVRNVTANPAAHDGWGGIAWMPDGNTIVTNTSAWERPFDDPFVRLDLGIASLLVQSALISGILLLIMRRGPLPVGAITLILGVNAALMTVLRDNYWYVIPAVIAGVAGDATSYLMRRRSTVVRARVLASGVPALWYAAYLVAVAFTSDGLGWSIHVIAGAPFLAGIAGYLMSLIAFSEGSASGLASAADDHGGLGA